MRVTIQIASKDRSSELGLLLQSLRMQTYQDFDVMILDDASGTLMSSFYYLISMMRRLRCEGHGVSLIRNGVSYGVCEARNLLLKEDRYKNDYILRLDDDVVLEPDYIERLINVIKQGYDMASGVTPMLVQPEIKRDVKFIKPIANKIEFDNEGNMINIGDDCGVSYIQSEIIPAHQLRSCFMFKRDIYTKSNIKFELGLGTVGFREESIFCIRAAYEGYKIAVDTGAIAWHLHTPSGGVRTQDYQQQVKFGDLYFRKWAKEQYLKRGNPFK